MNNSEFETEPTGQGSDSPLDELAVTSESVQKFLDERDKYDSSKHVCICGHAINKHSGYEEGYGMCQTARHICPCIRKEPVIYANDTRYFMRKTYGLGSKHALSTALLRLKQVGKTAHWFEKPSCWTPECKSGNPNIFPVALNRQSRIVNEPGHINVLLCETCILNMKGLSGNEGKGWIW